MTDRRCYLTPQINHPGFIFVMHTPKSPILTPIRNISHVIVILVPSKWNKCITIVKKNVNVPSFLLLDAPQDQMVPVVPPP